MRVVITKLSLFLLLLLPIILISNIGLISSEYSTIIINQLFNTLLIIGSVVTLSSLFGVSLAWSFAIYDFPFKRILEIILILGMVFPSYILAFFYSEVFNSFGIIPLILTMVVTTMPYIFMIVTMSIRSQSQRLVESALMLGKDDNWIKLKILLPLIKPAVILSSLLVMGDTFSEFGATYFYGVDTVMTGIYEIWFGLHEFEQGIRFSSWLFFLILMLYYFINIWKKSLIGQQPTLSNGGSMSQHIQSTKLKKYGWIITYIVLMITILTFFIPMSVLINWLFNSFMITDWFRVISVTFNSTLLATIISLLVLLFSTFILYLFKKRIVLISTIVNSLYSTPGIILSIGAIYLISHIELNIMFLIPVIFVYVLVLKYMALGIDTLGVGIQKINRQYYYSAKTLGKTSTWYVYNIQIPISIQSYLIAGILIWIDVIRELVIGLTLRPQWLDILSVEIFRYMDMELLYMSGPMIFSMVLITCVPIYWINTFIKNV